MSRAHDTSLTSCACPAYVLISAPLNGFQSRNVRSLPHVRRYAPLTLIAGGGKAYYLDNANLFCVDLTSGKQQWSTDEGPGGQGQGLREWV